MPLYIQRARVKNVLRAKKLYIEFTACNDYNLEVAKKEKSVLPPPFFEKKKKYGYIYDYKKLFSFLATSKLESLQAGVSMSNFLALITFLTLARLV